MKTFKVFSDGSGSYKAVKQGWCWPAFFFGSIWALFSALWALALVMLPIEFMISVADTILDRTPSSYEAHYEGVPGLVLLLILSIPVMIRIIFGARGNRWRANKLQKLGYAAMSSVDAPNKMRAISLARSSIEVEQQYSQRGIPAFDAPRHPYRESANEPRIEHSASTKNSTESHPFAVDSLLLLLAAIIGLAVCMTGIGFIAAGVLVFGFIASIKTGNIRYLNISTNFILSLGFLVFTICSCFAVFMQYVLINIPPYISEYGDTGTINIPILGMSDLYPYDVTQKRDTFAAFSAFALFGLAALKFAWLAPLTRQFDAIRAFLFDFRIPKFPERPSAQKIMSREGLHPYSVADELAKWKALYDQGAISADEYRQARGRLLNPDLPSSGR
ncbi:DUF2628 domain-containing protein [Sphingobium chungangianum]